MPKLPVLTPSEVIKILLKNGYFVERSKGSHSILIHREMNTRVVVPMHKKDLPKGTLFEIIKQSGLDLDKFR